MFTSILSFLAAFVIKTIEKSGYIGIGVLMALESANIPIPSEIIMPFSGFLASNGVFDFWFIVWAGTIGNVVGSVINYYLGYYGGRPFVYRWGRYFFVSHHDLEIAERWFEKYGNLSIFFSRMLPVVRTFISLPAGIFRMNIINFTVLTLLGSLPWSIALTYLGVKTGENWMALEAYFRKFDVAIVLGILIGIGYYMYKYLKK